MQWYALIRNLDRAAEQSAYRKTHKQRQTCLYLFWIYICIYYRYIFVWNVYSEILIGQQSRVHRKTHKQRQTRAQSREKSRPGPGPNKHTHTKLENTSTQINTNVNTTHIFTQAPWRLQDFNDRLFRNLGSCEVNDLPYWTIDLVEEIEYDGLYQGCLRKNVTYQNTSDLPWAILNRHKYRRKEYIVQTRIQTNQVWIINSHRIF